MILPGLISVSSDLMGGEFVSDESVIIKSNISRLTYWMKQINIRPLSIYKLSPTNVEIIINVVL